MPREWGIVVERFALHGSRPRRWLPRGRSRFWVYFGRYKFGLTASFGRGIQVCERWFRGATTPVELVPHLRWEKPNMRRRQANPVTGDQRHLAAVETTHLRDLMPLVEHCCIRKYDDGEPREVGWFTVKTMGAAWVVQVKDPDSCTSFSAIGDSIDKALETAALLLAAEEAPWEPDTFLQAAKARKKK